MSEAMNVMTPRKSHPSRDEVRSLIAAAQQGDVSARDALVEGNLRLVHSIAQRYRGRGFDADDLFQVGAMGLIKAIEKFDLTYDVAFSTYAVPLIIGEIRRYLREDQPVKVGRTMREATTQVKLVRDQLMHRLGRSPTPDEIANKLQMTREEVVMLLDADQHPVSLDQPIDSGEGRPVFLRDQLASEDTESAVDSLALAQVLRDLSEEERLVVTLRYLKQYSQTRVAEVISCSQAHVSRLEKRIIERLRRLWVS